MIPLPQSCKGLLPPICLWYPVAACLGESEDLNLEMVCKAAHLHFQELWRGQGSSLDFVPQLFQGPDLHFMCRHAGFSPINGIFPALDSSCSPTVSYIPAFSWIYCYPCAPVCVLVSPVEPSITDKCILLVFLSAYKAVTQMLHCTSAIAVGTVFCAFPYPHVLCLPLPV